MLCEKNRCRGTLFEYELMHNFHYFLCVLCSPLHPPFHNPQPARRTRIGGGGSAHGFSSYSISFLSLLACFAVAKGGKRGMGLRFQSQVCLGRIRHPHQIIYRTRSPAQPSPAQPCTDPVHNQIQSIRTAAVFISSACLLTARPDLMLSSSQFGVQGHYLG